MQTTSNNIKLIAEIGCSHVGDLNRAKHLTKLAKISGADTAKFQKRNPISCVPKDIQNKPHPNKKFAYGKTYLEHRENLELTVEEHKEIKKYCENIGIEYSTSVWDLKSAKDIVELNPKSIKIPSAANQNIKLMNYLFKNHNGEIHISTGMLTKKEQQELIKYLLLKDTEKIVIYHCTSAYPCPFEKLYLSEITELCKHFNRVGFSNHGYGIAADIAALTLGARYFERHFIDDRTFPHSDSSASLEPGGMSKLSRDLENVLEAFSLKPEDLDKLEEEQKHKLKIRTKS